MDYSGPQYTFSPEHGAHFGHQVPIHYSQHPSQPQRVESYFTGHPHNDFADFGHDASMLDDYEDGVETSTRPRLTKEQVDVLESQFQAQPKPNSNVKRQLAAQTKLTLPRVANWFQNRRAKAKQQKKQEEFEIKRAMGMADGWKSEGSLPSGYSVPLHVNATETSTNLDASPIHMAPSSETAARGLNSAQDPGWASLQRALSAAAAAQTQHALQHERGRSFTSMPPPPIPSSDQPAGTHTIAYSDWTPRSSSSEWHLSQPHDSLPFDFGFGQPDRPYSSDTSQSQDSPEASSVPGFAIPADGWPSTVHTPTFPNHPTVQAINHSQTTFSPTRPMDMNQTTTFPPPQVDTTFQLPQYPASRRGSASDELTSNFGNFALVSTPPVPSPLRAASDLESFKRNEGEVDLAARRKGPRPAPIGSAAMRSRSYGAPPMSPTLRVGSHSPHPHPVRHVKSMCQNLNGRYWGIRKPSSAQRSPLNVATFAEADAFRELLQSQQTKADLNAGTAPPTPASSDELVAHQFPIHEDGPYYDQDQHTPHQFYFDGQLVNFNRASPPSTPLNPEFYPMYLQTNAPLSAPPQYAAFPDHTPPYSAGLLTSSSCWSDAQFASNEMPYQMPQVMYPTAQDFSNGVFPNFSVSSQPKADMTCTSNTDQNQAEFHIQEFPRQKEEHAHAAQQLPQQKPKHYVFANATPDDF